MNRTDIHPPTMQTPHNIKIYTLPNGNKRRVEDVSQILGWHDVKAVEYWYTNDKLTGTTNHRDQTFQQVCEELEKNGATLTNG